MNKYISLFLLFCVLLFSCSEKGKRLKVAATSVPHAEMLAQIKDDLKAQPLINVRSYREAENRVAESFTQVENFLSLIGLIILVLGGIGISSVTRVFIQQKMKTIAVLKCLGGRNARVLGTYLIQVMALGLIGTARVVHPVVKPDDRSGMDLGQRSPDQLCRHDRAAGLDLSPGA